MKFGIREIIFLALMVALLGGTYVFVFSKTNAKRQAYLTDIRDKQRMRTRPRCLVGWKLPMPMTRRELALRCCGRGADCARDTGA